MKLIFTEAHSKRCLVMSIHGLCVRRTMELVSAVIIIPSICTTTWCTYIYWVFYFYKNYKIFPEVNVLLSVFVRQQMEQAEVLSAHITSEVMTAFTVSHLVSYEMLTEPQSGGFPLFSINQRVSSDCLQAPVPEFIDILNSNVKASSDTGVCFHNKWYR